MKDFSMQGKVWLGPNVAGKPGALIWVDDASTLDLDVAVDEEERTESYSGQRGVSAVLKKATKINGSLTLNAASAANLALAWHGASSSIAPGTETAEIFPAGLAAGDVIALNNGDISTLVITDSAGTPATLVANTNYSVESDKGGLVKIISTGSYVQPFKAAYAYGAQVRIPMLTQQAPEKYLVLDGINTYDGTRVKVRLYRVRFKPLAKMSLINPSLGDLQLSFSMLIDSNNVIDSALGGFGRIEHLGTAT